MCPCQQRSGLAAERGSASHVPTGDSAPRPWEFSAAFWFFAGSKIRHLLLLPPMLLLPPRQPLLLLPPRLSLPHLAAPFLTRGAAADGAAGLGPGEVLEMEAPTVRHPSCVSGGWGEMEHSRIFWD